MYKKLEKCLKSIREKTDFKPEKAVILGSGLGDYAEKIQIEKIVKYTEIEGFPVSTVQGHKGQFVFGYVKDVPVVLMQGRVHYYEGYSMQDVVLPTRLMGMMGAKKVLLPMDTIKDIQNVSRELLNYVQPIFYNDPIDAAKKALDIY